MKKDVAFTCFTLLTDCVGSIQRSAINQTTHIYTMTKTHIKSFATHGHMIQWWRDFKNDISGCHEIGNNGEYILKFNLKG